MEWISENFCSTAKAWNTLCDAIEERIEAYNVTYRDGIVIPRHPEALNKWNFDFVAMRNVIVRLLHISFPPHNFGRWYTCTPLPELVGGGGFDTLGKELSDKYGIDPYAFYLREPEVPPASKHTVSQFIFNAAKIVNDVCIYPMPPFSFSPKDSGFMMDADLELESFSPVHHITARQSTSGNLSYETDYGTVYCNNKILVEYHHRGGRSRAANQHWIYHNPGGSADSGYIGRYSTPVLKGTCGLRCPDARVLYSDITHPLQGSVRHDIDMDFIIDFETGAATKKVDYSAVQSVIDSLWDLDEENLLYNFYQANLRYSEPEVFLTEQNFPDYPGKYKYYTDKTA